jgi:DNA end-binding protein Ku
MPDATHDQRPATDDDAIEMSGRPIWSGTVTFGLVSVPVNIVSANVPRPIAFHMVSDEGRQLRRRYYRAKDDTPLTSDDIVRGYEYAKGKFVVVDDDELERIAPERTRDIDLRVFAPVKDIDPAYFVRAYYLTPVGSPRAYKLLARVMEERGRAGIATFVMRAKEYVAAIIAENGILRLETLRFADEIRKPADVGLPKPEDARPADVKRIQAMIKRLERKSLDLDELEDAEAEKLEALAKKKGKEGADVVALPQGDDEGAGQTDTNVVDLMRRLQESLTGSRRAKATTRRHKRARSARAANQS